jgi:cellulose synthase/poly-beta-1,6-N-acetylglucosamine synthase-like glycosyltransferase
MVIFFLALAISYILLLLILLKGWHDTKTPVCKLAKYPFITVLIPVRNEAANIVNLLTDLSSQTYPIDRFEVIVIDDSSTDGTSKQIIEYLSESSNVKIIELPEIHPNVSPKKRALKEGIGESKGELILTTDGDCRLGKRWIETFVSFYVSNDVKFISAGVFFKTDNKILNKIFQLEVLTLVGTGAASLKLGYPNMCNGANVAYTKEVFFEVEGFKGNENIASGDDEFLMHKVYSKYPEQVMFLKDANAYVSTSPPESLKHFYYQRKRWASKWDNYIFKHVKFLAFFVFLFNFFLLLFFMLTLAGEFSLYIFLGTIMFKCGFEFVFLYRLAKDFDLKFNVLPFLLVQILYYLFRYIG